MAIPTKVTIIGATGLIGQIILKALRPNTDFTVTVLSRQESSSTTEFPPGVMVHKTDFSPSSLRSLLREQDVLISAVGGTAFTEQKKFIDAAIEAGVKRFIPSEFSTSSEDDAVIELLPLFRQKRDIINYLKEKEEDGLSWTGIATSGLFDWGLASGFLGFDIKTKSAVIWDGGVTSFTLTNQEQLGKTVLSVILRLEETKNCFLYIASVETTQNEVLKTLEEVTESRWAVMETTTQEQVAEGLKKLGAGDISGAFALVRATAFGSTAGLKTNYVRDQNLANGLLGLEMESAKGIVERVFGV
ncbi:aromatic alcohol reductase [Aspergillus vadensis CBS 113365]|uniref:NmrA-like family protein n=1 Tax=Aspergillus vadensis (strain CBS 113365 / IMI 142717 / IBT 24658) TaxID=1448311 RepID=A0A319B2Q3_ASPVC|nr:NmrA-like family protein [Aspergillus vadensis CBS 113365]PYH64490.1 NmrA-like family protein [Aspergillus vadensis CBS 113365]